MLFNSYIFIFLFLPVALLGWYILLHFNQKALAKVFLSAMSLWFYGYFNVSYLAIILTSITVNYLLSFFMEMLSTENISDESVSTKSISDESVFTKSVSTKNVSTKALSITKFSEKKSRKIYMTAGIIFNLGILFYFKYYDFFLENINTIFHQNFNLKNIVLPLGISFFTFQQLSFIIDRGLGKAEHYSFIDYAAFVTFFPQLVAGPIVLHSEIIPQFNDENNHRFIADNFAAGIILFVVGLCKKILLADVLAHVVDYGFAQTFQLDSISTVFVVLCYTFELYFDFSGYCDMATGLAKMFNITLPVNFNSPYKACTVKEFWQKWHITLSRFFTSYVYIPLGGNRKGKARTLMNVFIVFLLSGLWHGASWTFVCWGIFHGLLVMFDNLHLVGIRGRTEKIPSKYHIPAWFGWLFTFSAYAISMIFFRSLSLTGAVQMFRNLISGGWTGKIFEVSSSLSLPEFYIFEEAFSIAAPSLLKYYYLIVLTLYLLMCFFIISRKNALEIASSVKLNLKNSFLFAFLFAWCVISLSQVSTFLYFNF